MRYSLLIMAVLVIMLTSCGQKEPTMKGLEPGFYTTEDPGFKQLWGYIQKASISIDLSGQLGISIPIKKKWGISFEEFKKELAQVLDTNIAHILMQKDFNDTALRNKVVDALRTAGFREIIVIKASSEGTQLDEYIKESATE